MPQTIFLFGQEIFMKQGYALTASRQMVLNRAVVSTGMQWSHCGSVHL